MELAEVLQCLRTVAPEALAEQWDAVGLHVGWQRQPVQRALVCIDLTEPVLAEAAAAGVGLIVAYHPPIFQPVSALTDAQPRGRILLEAIRRGMAIYSPHTALDAAAGGVNDFLADGLAAGRRWPVRPVPAAAFGDGPVPAAAQEAGAGRVIEFDEEVSLSGLAQRVKQRLGMDRLPVVTPDGGERAIKRVAVCPGAGGSLLAEAGPVDAFITGEMRHHDQLAAKANGTALILPGHSETERPYLPSYCDRLAKAGLEAIELYVSERDQAPTAIV